MNSLEFREEMVRAVCAGLCEAGEPVDADEVIRLMRDRDRQQSDETRLALPLSELSAAGGDDEPDDDDAGETADAFEPRSVDADSYTTDSDADAQFLSMVDSQRAAFANAPAGSYRELLAKIRFGNIERMSIDDVSAALNKFGVKRKQFARDVRGAISTRIWGKPSDDLPPAA